MATNLNDVASAYADYLNGKFNGGGIWFSATTDYDGVNSKQLDKYKNQYQMSAVYESGSITYTNVQPVGDPVLTLFGTAYVNNTSGSGVATASMSETTTTSRSFSWTKTTTTSVGTEVSASIGFTKIFNGSAKISTTLTLTDSTTDTFQDTQSWTADFSYTVPAGQQIYGACYVTSQQYSANWTAMVTLSGSVAIWFKTAIDLNTPGGTNKHHLWFTPIYYVIADCLANTQIDVAGYTLNDDGSTVSLEYDGTVSGVEGINMYATWSQNPIPGNANEIVLSKASILKIDAFDNNTNTTLIGAE